MHRTAILCLIPKRCHLICVICLKPFPNLENWSRKRSDDSSPQCFPQLRGKSLCVPTVRNGKLSWKRILARKCSPEGVNRHYAIWIAIFLPITQAATKRLVMLWTTGLRLQNFHHGLPMDHFRLIGCCGYSSNMNRPAEQMIRLIGLSLNFCGENTSSGMPTNMVLIFSALRAFVVESL